MALTCSDGLKANAIEHGGNYPCARITVYDVAGTAGKGGGLSRGIYDTISGHKIWPATGLEDVSPLMAFRWGDSPPLGITPSMLTDGRSYQIWWNGFFLFDRPAAEAGLVTYTFAYVSTGNVTINVDGATIAQGVSANKLNVSNTIGITGHAEWLPISISFSREGSGGNRRLQDERFVLFWKDDIDDVWRVVGADYTSTSLTRFENTINSPIASIGDGLAWASPYQPDGYALNEEYTLYLHKVGGLYHVHIGSNPTEYGVAPGTTQEYDLQHGVLDGDHVNITWSASIADGDEAVVYTDGYRNRWILPGVNDIDINMSNEAASTLSFTVPVTTGGFDEDDVNRNNAYTYQLSTESFGVLRKNRLIEAEFGYYVSGVPEYIKRFTGFIQDVKPSHSVVDGSPKMMISVTCIDASIVGIGAPVTTIENIPMGPQPDYLAYDIIQRFAETTTAGPDGKVRPPAFDRWKVADVVRTVLYQRNFTSAQLWAKDANGNYLIDDRDLYLDSTQAYPYAYATQYGTKSSVNDYSVPRLEASKDVYSGISVGYNPDHGGVGNWLAKTFLKEDNMTTKPYWTYSAGVSEEAYLYSFEFDSDPWNKLQEMCAGFGLRLYTNTDGNVVLKYPNNPVVYNTHDSDTDPNNYLTYDAGWAKVPASDNTDATDMFPIRSFLHKADGAGIATVNFVGVGLVMIFSRPVADSEACIDIDDIRVDGVNVLDVTTGDVGHSEWIEYTDGSGHQDLSLDLSMNNGTVWYYANGIHPMIGRNPCVFTICNNLTYGAHHADITRLNGDVYIEGFMVITNAVDVPVHEFESTVDISNIEYQDSLDEMINDVTVIGNPTGAENAYIAGRATDLFSISDPSAPNYIGVRKSATIITPKVNQAMADFLAQHILLKYRRGHRTPSINTVGIPYLEPDDCVSILDIKVGMYKDLGVDGWHDALYFTRYWVESITENYSVNDGAPEYRMTIPVTSYSPLPAYELLPEPSPIDYPNMIANVNITIDDDDLTYNPYLEDYSGKYVNIEFGLARHCRMVSVRIITSEAITAFGMSKYPSKPVNVLFAKTGFIPSGRHLLHWDGWMQNSDGTGKYAPDGFYAVEFECQKYDTGETFYFRSDSEDYEILKNNESGTSLATIVIDQDYTIYGTPRYAVATTPSEGTANSPAAIYDDTNSGNGIKLDLELDCPAKAYITATVRHFFAVDNPPVDTDTGVFIPQEQWFACIPAEADAPLLDKGDYTLYFNSKQMLTKDGNIMPFNLVAGSWGYTDVQGKDWWVCWHVEYRVRFTDKGTNYTADGDNYFCWGGPSASDYDPSDIVERHDSLFTYRFYRIRSAP